MDYLTAPRWLARLVQTWHVERARMGRLLRLRGIEPAAYVRATPIVGIESQLARCYSCPRKVRCDRVLRTGTTGGAGYAFCPNSAMVERYRRRS